jgi:hypothetical protein
MSDDELKLACEARGYGRIVEIVHKATVLYSGWEMDNEAWVCRMQDGLDSLLKAKELLQ